MISYLSLNFFILHMFDFKWGNNCQWPTYGILGYFSFCKTIYFNLNSNVKTSSDEHIFLEGTKTVKNVVPFYRILLPSYLTGLLIHLFNMYFNEMLILQIEIGYKILYI